eukprot:CAMPEP_0119315070 /NCGR_PEP_ID=MMETSP1333-20130426/34355_1 /TAXON_ID=418940 /ORGANISM="Scyphosphaera apsteinii, Strain RCC1455" /LENGTH=639 /DNA_ID=CAMNT_0007320299 /DNA_START=127 /DNA_END=2047 /DNA_ORIENTATION=-
MAEETDMDTMFEDLMKLGASASVQVIHRWLEHHRLDGVITVLNEAISQNSDLNCNSEDSKPAASAANMQPPPVKPLVPTKAPAAEALPVPGTSSRPAKLYDADSVNPAQLPEQLLTKPDPVFHGERDERKREAAELYDFAMQVHYDPLTSGLESETHFRVEEKQVIAGRYVVIQYLGSGTFCHTVQCEDLRGIGRHRFVCVKISKNTKDIFDQNLWEVKLLKLLANKMTRDESERLPELLNVFYFRETLFIVYELLRDNLYHIYKYIEECKLPKYFTVERLKHVAYQCLCTLACLHKHDVIHCDLKPENILISSLTSCQIKVIDYGNAYLHHDQRCSYVQSRAYRAPEVVLGLPYSPKVDLWSLGCILMELFTGKLLFDNRSVQALLCSHIAVLGPFPKNLLREGCLTDHYFPDHSESAQLKLGLVGKHDGRICRLKPKRTSIASILASHACDDVQLVNFITQLMNPDPKERPSAADALNHPWLANLDPKCTPYRLTDADVKGEAGLRLLQKYTSLNNVDQQSSGSRHGSGGMANMEEEMPGPATPTAFREQCYLNRERMEKKRARKSGASRLGNSDMPNLDHMVISPSTLEGKKYPTLVIVRGCASGVYMAAQPALPRLAADTRLVDFHGGTVQVFGR